MLRVENLNKSYGSFQVLKDVSFEIKKGSIYGFLGENGAGKTTTMNILTGLIGYNSGDISIDGEDFKANKRKLLKKIGYLPQHPVFYGYMNAFEYLKFIGELSNMSSLEIKKRSNELLEIVKLKDAAKRKISGYSGGMLQRLGIAVAMFNKPEIIFLDEPTSALDPTGRMEVMDLMEVLKNQGMTIFLSTHILSDIERICEQVSILNKGKIILSDDLQSLKNNYLQPIYDIEFEKICGSNIEELRQLNWIENIKSNKNKLSVYVKNVEKAKHSLLNEISKFKNPVISYNLRKSTLEDIFIRKVNENVSL